MSLHRFHSALLPDGWAHDVLVRVGHDGMIASLDTGADAARTAAASSASTASGIAVPGMPNAHSHAFQRAMAAAAEFRRSARDSFWTWRNAMYALANRIDPAGLEVIARQLFIEMLEAGYTSVAEFHYIHRRPDGSAYGASNGGASRGASDPDNPLHAAVLAAAKETGIGLTFLPTLYQHSDFGAAPLREDQRRFASTVDEFMDMVEALGASQTGNGLMRRGVAFHSLRAVGPAALRDTCERLRLLDPTMPVHLHIAEQVLEVKACLAATGQRPVQWLLSQNVLTPQWCLVHATHADREELRGVAASGASVAVCTTTEANLGDGLFDTAHFLKSGGLVCVGSDSEVCVDPAEELRWLEYQQRLKRRRRAVLADRSQPHVGTRLWSHAARAGARALGQPVGELRVGARADWLVLDETHPALAGAPADQALDRLVFGGARAAIREVVVAGRAVAQGGRHALHERSRAEFLALMRG